MSRYVLTQEHLDSLQDQIQQRSRVNDATQERIKELELFKVRVKDTKTADLIQTIVTLEDENKELKKINKELMRELSANKANAGKIKELEMLLNEERKLREYSETFAKQIELKCAEESLIKELTAELCQLQRAEIEIESKKIEELQKKLKNSTNETNKSFVNNQKEIKQVMNKYSRENFLKNQQLKNIIQELGSQLSDMYGEVDKKKVRTKEEEMRIKEVEKWMREVGSVMADINDIENIRKDLKHLRNEIESRRKSSMENKRWSRTRWSE